MDADMKLEGQVVSSTTYRSHLTDSQGRKITFNFDSDEAKRAFDNIVSVLSPDSKATEFSKLQATRFWIRLNEKFGTKLISLQDIHNTKKESDNLCIEYKFENNIYYFLFLDESAVNAFNMYMKNQNISIEEKKIFLSNLSTRNSETLLLTSNDVEKAKNNVEKAKPRQLALAK
ncbi:MAG: hypothetical protein QXD51_00815 [Candidatus Anstonellales archaeon]